MNDFRLKSIAALLLMLAGFATLTAQAATRAFTLYMTEADKTITIHLYNSSYVRTFWVEGFTDVAGRAPDVSGVKLWANEGDTINLTVYNNTAESHGFAITNSVLANTAIAAGASKTFSFAAPKAGEYIYYDPNIDAQTKVANRAVGMYGPLVIYPAGKSPGLAGSFWANGPSYTADYTWVLSDFDKKVNAADKAGTAFSGTYKATYAFINGDFGLDAIKNHSISPQANVGDTVAIRLVNAGMISHPVHFHGYHGSIVAINNVQQTRVLEKDAIDVPAMTTMEVLFHIDQRGMYIVHDHTGMMVTQDGIYAEGMIAEFDVCTKSGGLTANDPYCPIPTIGAGAWGGTNF